MTAGIDREQLTPLAEQARAATGIDQLTVVADRGYFKSEQIRQCEQAGITPILPKSLTSNSRADGRFDKQDFIYIAADDEYRCPAGQRAIKRFTTIEARLTLNKYWSSACPRCPLKARPSQTANAATRSSQRYCMTHTFVSALSPYSTSRQSPCQLLAVFTRPRPQAGIQERQQNFLLAAI